MPGTQWLTKHKALQCLETQGEFTHGKRTLHVQATLTQSFEIFRHIIFGTIDDTQVLGSTTFDRRLNGTMLALRDKLQGLDHHAFTTTPGQLLPPAHTLLDTDRIGDINGQMRRGK